MATIGIKTATVTMTAGIQAQEGVDITGSYGDLVGLTVEITTTATTGTSITSPASSAAALSSIKINDAQSNPIWSSIAGVDLFALEGMAGGLKKFAADTAVVAATPETTSHYIPLSIANRNLPAKIYVTVAPYSALGASGVTGGSVTYVIKGHFVRNAGVTTRRVRKQTLTCGGAGDFAFGPNLAKTMLDQLVFFSIGSEANLTSVTANDGTGTDLEGLTVEDMKTWERANWTDEHQTGFFALPLAPFVVANPRLDFTISSADVLTIFEIYMDPNVA